MSEWNYCDIYTICTCCLLILFYNVYHITIALNIRHMAVFCQLMSDVLIIDLFIIYLFIYIFIYYLLALECVICCRKSWSVSFMVLVDDKLYFFKEQKTDTRLVSEKSPMLWWLVVFESYLHQFSCKSICRQTWSLNLFAQGDRFLVDTV